MKRKIRIRQVSAWNIGITLIVGFLFALISMAGEKKFHVLQSATEQYIACENAAKQLQDGSDYLTEQVRLYAMNGQREYMDLYFEEAEVTRRRETALESLQEYFDGTSVFAALQSAMECSEKLMQTEYYSMRLTAQAQGDKILKEVASLLKRTFRSIDYICRIGGDEFAIVMVEMTSDLAYTIREKISNINQTLSKGEKEYPGVSLSVGVAFSDRKNLGESIFKDADQALYYVKEHGKHGCSFYGEHTEKEN